MPLLHRNLSETYKTAVPAAALADLWSLYQNNTHRNLFLSGSLLNILRLLNEHNILSVPFKGPVLAVSAYGDLTLRQFSDLDIMVLRQDVLKAKELLVAQGAQLAPQGYQITLTDAQEAFYVRTQCNYNFEIDQGRIMLELHWAFAPKYFSFDLEPGCLWNRLQSTSLVGTTVPNVAPEDLLLILSSHGARHCWQRLAWICDIAELLRRNQGLDWDRVLREARRLGSERVLLLGLRLAQDLLGAQLPSSVARRALADRAVPALVGHVRRRLFDSSGDSEDEARFQVFHLRARERLRDKVSYSLGWALTPTVREWEALALPASLAFFYYVFRPLRLIGNYGAGILASSKARVWHHNKSS